MKQPLRVLRFGNLLFVLRHHTRMIANQDGSGYSTRCSAAYAVYREDQWQRRSKHTELES
jgi:hypothetical protein